MGRKRRDKKATIFRLYPETHHALLRLAEELDLKEVEQLLELLIATFRKLIITANQFQSIRISENHKTANQLSENCLSDLGHSNIRILETFKTANQLSDFCLSVIEHYREIRGGNDLPKALKPLRDIALGSSKSDLLQRLATLTAEVSPANPRNNIKGNNIKEINTLSDPSTYVEGSVSPQDPYGSFGDIQAESEREAKDQTSSPNPPISKSKVGEKNINNNTADATEYHSQSQEWRDEETSGTPEHVPEKVFENQGAENTKNANEGKGLYDFAKPCKTSTFSERMEEHRKRLSKLLQEEGLKWKVERLMLVVKEWEREWGEWKEEWDRYLVDLLRYPIHEKRIAGKIRKMSFPEDVEPSFPYIAVPALKDIKRAEAEGKEVVETLFGDIKLRRKRKKKGELTAKDILNLWNEKAKEEKLMKKTELTPSLKSEIETYLELHPEKEWWERVFSLVPYAVGKTRSPSEPRTMDWLFVKRKKGGGKIIDWVLTLEGEAQKSEKETKLMMGKRLEKLLRALEENGISREEFKAFLKSRKVKVEKKEDGRVFFFSWRKGDREFERFFSLVSADKLSEAVECLKRELMEVVR